MLTLCTVLSFLLGAASFAGLSALSNRVIDRVICSKDKIVEKEKALFSEFVRYMNERGLSISDRAAVQGWVGTKKDLMLAVYNARTSYFLDDGETLLYSSVSDALTMYDLLQNEYADYWYSCLVSSGADHMRSQVVKTMYFPMYRIRGIARAADLSAAFLVFVGALLMCIRRKTQYIALLSRELQAMQGGDLGVPMTIRGRDELTTLAGDIDEMRKSFIDRLNHEEAMAKNASELLTAMSHDLRTPLTSLIGYLDIVELEKYADEAQMRRYIHLGKLKAYQIKEMTDKLFEYFLVYSPDEKKMETETVDAATVMSQLWAESACILETDGFVSSVSAREDACGVDVNVPFLRRVFDNIVSNVRKYADPGEPVLVSMGAEGENYAFRVQNAVADAQPRGESSGIGLASCRKIMEKHGGTFETRRTDGQFECRLTLPIARNKTGA